MPPEGLATTTTGLCGVQDADATTAPALPAPAPPVVGTVLGAEGTGEGVAMPRVAVTVVVAATGVSSATGAPTTTRASIAATGATCSGSSTRCSRYRGEYELPDRPCAPPAASNGMHSIATFNVYSARQRTSVSDDDDIRSTGRANERSIERTRR